MLRRQTIANLWLETVDGFLAWHAWSADLGQRRLAIAVGAAILVLSLGKRSPRAGARLLAQA